MTPEQRVNSGRKPGSVPWNKGIKTGLAPWRGKTRGPHSAETRAKMRAAALGKPKTASHAAHILGKMWHGPKPLYRGVEFRSSYEVRFARTLDVRGVAWQYEPRRFDLGSCSYLPDFYLPEFGAYVEVKGYFSPESQTKVALFRASHPEYPLVVVMRQLIERLEQEEQNHGGGNLEDHLGLVARERAMETA
jgi:hypothetical protein